MSSDKTFDNKYIRYNIDEHTEEQFREEVRKIVKEELHKWFANDKEV